MSTYTHKTPIIALIGGTLGELAPASNKKSLTGHPTCARAPRQPSLDISL